MQAQLFAQFPASEVAPIPLLWRGARKGGVVARKGGVVARKGGVVAASETSRRKNSRAFGELSRADGLIQSFLYIHIYNVYCN